MNSTESYTEPLPQSDEEPIKLHELVTVTALIVFTCVGVAACFTTIATCQYVDDTIKRFRKKGGRHAPK
jgi:hypothetical protein